MGNFELYDFPKWDIAPCLTARRAGDTLAYGDAIASKGSYLVRKLTPVECERLQGFPDNWTQIPWKGKPAESCPDLPRYKALGNSWAVPCAAWVGRRIAEQLEAHIASITPAAA